MRGGGGFQRWDQLEGDKLLRRDPCSLGAVLPRSVCLSSSPLPLSSSPISPLTLFQTPWGEQLGSTPFSYDVLPPTGSIATKPEPMNHEFWFHEAKEILPSFKFFHLFVSAADSLNNNIEQLSRVSALQDSSPTSSRQFLRKSWFHGGRRRFHALVCMSHPQVPRVVNDLVSAFYPGRFNAEVYGWATFSRCSLAWPGACYLSLPRVLSGHVFHFVSILAVPWVAASGSIV